MAYWCSREERKIFFDEYGMPIRSMAKVFECSVQFYDPFQFAKEIVKTKIFNRYQDAYTLFSQSPYYVLEWIQEEFAEKNIHIKPYDENNASNSKEEMRDSMHWLGYLLMYWKISRNIKGKELLQYDIDHILEFADIFHTEDVEVTIERAMERKEKLSIMKES